MVRSGVLALVLLAAAPLAACGDDDSGHSPSTSTTSRAEADAVSTTEADTAPMTTPATTAEPADAATSSAPAMSAAPDTSAAAAAERVVVSFAEAGSIEGWSNVDDTVMGGVSASTTSWEDGRLVFAGDLSLENNGGFTSIRSPQDAALGSVLDGADAIGVVAEGDGRTYVLQLRTADELLYIARFATVDGEQQRYELPLDGFEPVTRFLDPAPDTPPLDPSTVVQLAIYLLDGQVGPFRLAVSAVDAT